MDLNHSLVHLISECRELLARLELIRDVASFLLKNYQLAHSFFHANQLPAILPHTLFYLSVSFVHKNGSSLLSSSFVEIENHLAYSQIASCNAFGVFFYVILLLVHVLL